jgi:hypothetical protein
MIDIGDDSKLGDVDQIRAIPFFGHFFLILIFLLLFLFLL